mmetsp:Transcript_41411/g.90939  ORF Transcript_41411/g.90939 Transcript_41411/m.90939 type:complete len:237 (+) Transcript_41411:99-809(+)
MVATTCRHMVLRISCLFSATLVSAFTIPKTGGVCLTPSVSSSSPSMLMDLPARGPFGHPLFESVSSQAEQRTDTPWVDFSMEFVHFTKRRVKGGLRVDANVEDVWRLLNSFEKLPDIIPSIISHAVTRRGDGSILIDQVSLLSRRLNLQTQMRLLASPSDDQRSLRLQRLSGHGFLEFDAVYTLEEKSDGTTYLSYSVDLVPCPIFPLPVVEQKIKKEVPRMLTALRDAAIQQGSP